MERKNSTRSQGKRQQKAGSNLSSQNDFVKHTAPKLKKRESKKNPK